MTELTHLNARGEASMVDVSAKATTPREARAHGLVRMSKATLAAIFGDGVAKGDVLAVARVAGIQAAKRTSELIPLCHPLPLNKVGIDFDTDGESALTIEAVCKVTGRTGVEMEALTAVTVAALTVYDMCKAIDRGMTIETVGLMAKSGGKSGTWTRGGPIGTLPVGAASTIATERP